MSFSIDELWSFEALLNTKLMVTWNRSRATRKQAARRHDDWCRWAAGRHADPEPQPNRHTCRHALVMPKQQQIVFKRYVKATWWKNKCKLAVSTEMKGVKDWFGRTKHKYSTYPRCAGLWSPLILCILTAGNSSLVRLAAPSTASARLLSLPHCLKWAQSLVTESRLTHAHS